MLAEPDWVLGQPFLQTLKLLHPQHPQRITKPLTAASFLPWVNEARDRARRRLLPPHLLLCASECLAQGEAGSKQCGKRWYRQLGPGQRRGAQLSFHEPPACPASWDGVREQGEGGGDPGPASVCLGRPDPPCRAKGSPGMSQGGQWGWGCPPRLRGKEQPWKLDLRKSQDRGPWPRGCSGPQAVVQQATYSHSIFAGAGLARSPAIWWTTSTRAPSSSCSWYVLGGKWDRAGHQEDSRGPTQQRCWGGTGSGLPPPTHTLYAPPRCLASRSQLSLPRAPRRDSVLSPLWPSGSGQRKSDWQISNASDI